MEVRAEAVGGDATAWRCSADADAVGRAGRRGSLAIVAVFGLGGASLFDVACISPTAEETLLVKEEIAQPVHEAASLGCGVPIRGVAEVEASEVVGGYL